MKKYFLLYNIILIYSISTAQELNSNTSFLLQKETAIHPTDSNFDFEVGDWDKDGKPDVFVIKKNGPTSTEVHILGSTSDYQQYILHSASALHPTDSNFDFEVGDWDKDGKPDVFVIKKNGPTSTEIHILGSTSDYQQYILHSASALHQTDDNFDFEIGDWDKDGKPDVFAIKKNGQVSTEVHILGSASDYQQFIIQTSTALHPTDSNFDFEVDDWDKDGFPDLFVINRKGIGTNSTQVHILSGASHFKQFILHTGTVLHQTDHNFAFTVGDWNLDKQPDLFTIKKQNTGSNSMEVHIVNLLPISSRENNCFQLFDNAATGRNDVNAYLLSYLSRIVYVDYLNKENDYKITEDDHVKFEEKFIERTKHFFDNSTAFKWIQRSDGQGRNPEAMLISTPQAIFIIFRGTDRVDGGRKSFFSQDFQWGEWIYTDFKIFKQKPCNDCNVQVHEGFYESLKYEGFYEELVDLIKKHRGDTKKVWITGHSLGGGLAQLFGYLLKKVNNIEAQGIYVYNSPHPGDLGFATEMNAIFTNQRVQRFEFLDDPVASGPPQILNGIPLPSWIPINTKWGRAGTRNWFSKETADGYHYNTNEKQPHEDISIFSGLGLGFFGGLCFHHPTWINRGLYNLLPPEIQNKLPTPPPRIVSSDVGCNTIDIINGNGTITSALPGTDKLEPGNYQIKNVSSGRFLKATNDCGFLNGCCDLRQSSSSAGNLVVWKIEKVPNALIESYTMTSTLNNKVIDADAPNILFDECKVHLCGRLPIAVPLRTNQEWQFEKLPNGNYRIKCVAGNKFLRVAPGCSGSDGCRFELHGNTSPESEWQLVWIN